MTLRNGYDSLNDNMAHVEGGEQVAKRKRTKRSNAETEEQKEEVNECETSGGESVR